MLKNPSNAILFFAASSWEIAIKYVLGRLPLPEFPDQFIPKRLARDGITPLSIEHAHVLNTVHLPQYRRDPFDRLMISQAILENTPVLISNEAFAKYDVEIIKT